MKRWWYSSYDGDPNRDNLGVWSAVVGLIFCGFIFMLIMLDALGAPLFVAFVIGLLVYLWNVFKPGK
jgi:hypothetical protein